MLLTPSPCHKLSHLLGPLPLERDVLYGRSHGKWKALKKGASNMSGNQRSKETAFVDSLDDLFDVADADAMKLINIEEDRKFGLGPPFPGAAIPSIRYPRITNNNNQPSPKNSSIDPFSS